jgi:uncharacterized protein
MSTSIEAPASSDTLVGVECTQCQMRAFPPAEICSNCLSEDLAQVELPRDGTLYASSIIRVGPKTRTVPYGVGYVDLAGDVRVFVHFDPANPLAPGDEVHLHVGEDGVPVAESAEAA